MTYSWGNRWRRDLNQLEERLNEHPMTRYTPMDESDMKQLGRGAGALVLLKLVQDYVDLEVKKREFEVESRVRDIASQVRAQLQEGQEVRVGISVQRAPDVRVTASMVEPVRGYPQLRASDGRPQPVWTQDRQTQGSATEILSVQVRKPIPGEEDKCLLQDHSASQPVTTSFRVLERNETIEVRRLDIPQKELVKGEVPTQAPSHLDLMKRPADSDRGRYEVEMRQIRERAEVEAAAQRAEERAASLKDQFEHKPSIP